jgi:hypothetical protein
MLIDEFFDKLTDVKMDFLVDVLASERNFHTGLVLTCGSHPKVLSDLCNSL